ncbi:MAG: hypothetical protein AB7P14_25480 [Blastocatellales bacterium]
MRQTAMANAKVTRKHLKSKTGTRPNGDPPMIKSEMTENEIDPAADFIVGALLYSLLVSHRSECIIAMLPFSEES